MELPPLFPENFTANEVSSAIRYSLQEIFQNEKYDKQVANNIVQFTADPKQDEFNSSTINASEVLKVYEEFDKRIKVLKGVEHELFNQHAACLVEQNRIETSSGVIEGIRSKPCGLFKKMSEGFKDQYGLIGGEDLLPDIFRRYLDFRFDEYIKYYKPCKETPKKVARQKPQIKHLSLPESSHEEKKSVNNFSPSPLRFVPDSIIFTNCEPGQTYKKTVKAYNASSKLQAVVLKESPKLGCFKVDYDLKSKIAPGMSFVVKIYFSPKDVQTEEDSVTFKNREGALMYLPIRSARDSPELITYIFKSNLDLTNYLEGYKDFIEARREVLNSTIDCGTCLMGKYVSISVVIQNRGPKGKFFIITEKEFAFRNIESISFNMELSLKDFWIYPAYFEIDKGDIVEINIIFKPVKVGLHLEMLYIMCDNYSYEKIEILGDAISFHKSLLTVEIPPNEFAIEEKENFCVYLGDVQHQSVRTFNVVVRNKSGISITGYWEFVNKLLKRNVYDIDKDWITLDNMHEELPPYRSKTFKFKFNIDSKVIGYHNIFLKFIVSDINQMSIEAINDIEIRGSNSAQEFSSWCRQIDVDVKILEFEVACFVAPPMIPKIKDDDTISPRPQTNPKQLLELHPAIISLGILPLGLEVYRELSVKNLTKRKIKWHLSEVHSTLDIPLDLNVIYNNVQPANGIIEKKGSVDILYTVITNEARQHVSILVLTCDESPHIQSVCVVTYQVIEYDVVVNTGHSIAPILCPLNILYVGVPVEINFTIENRSYIAGCYYFLPHFGTDSDKVALEFSPKKSLLNPVASVTVTARLTCNNVGIFQEIYVPCFIGMSQDPIMFRVMCAACDIEVFFYLPVEEDKLNKILWPPKIICEYETCSCEETLIDIEDFLIKPILEDEMKVLDSLQTEVTLNSTMSKSTNACAKLRELLEEAMGDDIKFKDEIIEMPQVPVKNPLKLSVYVENITPINAEFLVETEHFKSCNDFRFSLLELITSHNKDEIWGRLVDPNYGILVHPEVERGSIKGNEAIKINFWIYATTWGIYKEDITVQIGNISSFQFSLLIEVVGSPVLLPIALNSPLDHPILRLCDIPYNSNPFVKNIIVRNQSCVALTVKWSSFRYKSKRTQFTILFDFLAESEGKGNLFLLDDNFGEMDHGFCKILPDEVILPANSDTSLRLHVLPKYFDDRMEKTEAIFFILGIIQLPNDSKKKNDYFYRPTGVDVNRIKIEIRANLEDPRLDVDPFRQNFFVYANEVLSKKPDELTARVLLQNRKHFDMKVTFTVNFPFFIKTSRSSERRLEEFSHRIESNSCFEIFVTCSFSPDEIITMGAFVYEEVPEEKFPQVQINHDENRINIVSNFEIHYQEQKIQQFPLGVTLQYPKIWVSSSIIKFDTIALNQTSKSFVTVYNSTGYEVSFEVQKCSTSQCFYISPHYGVIARSPGSNESFANIFAYFTPRQCRPYYSSFRILVRNFPNYDFEVKLSGYGSLNNKFCIEYKI